MPMVVCGAGQIRTDNADTSNVPLYRLELRPHESLFFLQSVEFSWFGFRFPRLTILPCFVSVSVFRFSI